MEDSGKKQAPSSSTKLSASHKKATAPVKKESTRKVEASTTQSVTSSRGSTPLKSSGVQPENVVSDNGTSQKPVGADVPLVATKMAGKHSGKKRQSPAKTIPLTATKTARKSVPLVATKAARRSGTRIPVDPPQIVSSFTLKKERNEVKPENYVSSNDTVQGPSIPDKIPTKKEKDQPPANDLVVSSKMTVAQLKEECKARDPQVKCMSKGKDWLLNHLGPGTEREASAEWQAKQDSLSRALHQYDSLCHRHLLADSTKLRAPKKMGTRCTSKRSSFGVCDVNLTWLCRQTPYRTCELCNFDICEVCYEFESVPEDEKQRALNVRYDEMRRQEAEMQRRYEEKERRREEESKQQAERYERDRLQRMEEEHGEDLKRFPSHVRYPSSKHLDKTKKLKYTVWKEEEYDEKEFDSSFDSLREANLRVEFVFYYEHPSGCDKDEISVDTDEQDGEGIRIMKAYPDDGGPWTVSAVPSVAFDFFDLAEEFDCSSRNESSFYSDYENPNFKSFRAVVRNPEPINLDRGRKLKYTEWTSCGYDNDGWHSYEGPPDKEFNSSYATLQEANERVEYVFWFKNPWGFRFDEMDGPEKDVTSKDGLRLLECAPDDSERWTVSVVPSVAFEYL